jgi:transcriptional regulator with XRE-family HTH domain
MGDIAGAVRAAMARAKVTHAEMAHRLGIATSTFRYRIAGDRRFSVEDLLIIATALGTTPSELLADAEAHPVKELKDVA